METTTTARESLVAKARQQAIDEITRIADGATAEDRALVDSLQDRAKLNKRDSAVVKLTPGAAALLFIEHNEQNREWKHQVSEGYAEEIKTGNWEFTNQGIGFLPTGNLGDGQHRAAGIALAGVAIEIPITFGMSFESIIAIDTGHRRQASDFLAIEKATEPKRKQAVLRQAFATLKRLAATEEEARPYLLTTNRETVAAIKAQDRLLTEAMQIGDDSVRGRSKPTFKASEASALAFLLLHKGWPKAKVIADLDTFQSGEDREGGNTPLFVAADQLAKDKQKKDGATTAARFAVAIKAFQLHEQGVKAVRVADIRSVMKTKSVDVTFPGTATTQAAE